MKVASNVYRSMFDSSVERLRFGNTTRWQESGDIVSALKCAYRFHDYPLVGNVSARLLSLRQEKVSQTHTCQSIRGLINEFGVNGATALVPMQYFHLLSQIAGDEARSLVVKSDVRKVMQVLAFLAQRNTKFKRSTNAKGLIHGAVWYLVATMEMLTWPDVYALLPLQVSPREDFPEESLHGVGHGLLIRTSSGAMRSCDHHPVAESYSALEQMAHFCGQAQTAKHAFMCANGLYHAYVEYFHDHDRGLLEWLFPCSEFVLSGWCFAWTFGQGMIYQEGKVQRSHRLYATTHLKTHITSVCTADAMKAEANVLGCIWGLSTFYLHYHEGWVAEKTASSGPIDACARTPHMTTANPVICHLLMRNISQRRTTSNSSLVDWCSFFVPTVLQISNRDFHRWMVCLHGALFEIRKFILKRGMHALCVHDLPGQVSNPVWERAASWCREFLACDEQIWCDDDIGKMVLADY